MHFPGSMTARSAILGTSILAYPTGCSTHEPPEARRVPTSLPSETTDKCIITSVNYSDLSQGKITVIGPLYIPLGDLTRIRGALVPETEKSDYWSVNIARNLFAVVDVNGVELSRPVRIQLVLPVSMRIEPGRTYELLGYQDGGFINPPPNIFDGSVQVNRSFEVEFHVYEYPTKP